ncbi:MAG: Gfo/Idh/MocA family protein [Planctomycetaceae bacterium]
MLSALTARRTFLATAAAGLCAVSDAATRSRGPVRIGQIGVGHAHASKLSVYRNNPDYEVVGIVEPDEQLRKAAQDRDPWRNLPWMTREQLLNTPGLQAVLVETQVRDLLDHAAACVAAGKHVHIDKPAGQSLPQFAAILQAAEQQKLLVQMGYMYRYNPGIVLLRQLLRDGCLGQIFEVHTVMSKVVAAADRTELAQFPGGMMFELGCHILDLVVGILGEPTDVTPYIRHSASVSDGLNDNMLAVLQYAQATATVRTTALEIDGGRRRHLTVCGTAGTFHLQPLDNPAATLTLSAAHGNFKAGTQDISFPRYVRYVDDAADMARIIRGEKATDFPYAHDLAVQRTLLRACGENPPTKN